MNTAPTTSFGKPAAERYFYSVATALLLVLTVVGFQLFYFHGQAYPGHPLTPPIKTLAGLPRAKFTNRTPKIAPNTEIPPSTNG